MKAKVIKFEDGKVTLQDETGAQGEFALGEKVKPEFIKVGTAEVSLNPGRDTVTYIKMDSAKPVFGGKPKAAGFGKPKEEPEEKKFYKTKHLVFSDLSDEDLRKALDLASEQNWVIATQTHREKGKWCAVIYYKVKPE